MTSLTHTDASGRASMVDVGEKPVTHRVATAMGAVRMAESTLALVRDNGFKKGDVLAVARIAGIQGAKRTDELIPLCHGLPLENVQIDFELDDALPGVRITATASVYAKTGIEMEALAAVSTAALTIYDMCKAVDRGMVIGDICLLRKEGGRSGSWSRDEEGTD